MGDMLIQMSVPNFIEKLTTMLMMRILIPSLVMSGMMVPHSSNCDGKQAKILKYHSAWPTQISLWKLLIMFYTTRLDAAIGPTRVADTCIGQVNFDAPC